MPRGAGSSCSAAGGGVPDVGLGREPLVGACPGGAAEGGAAVVQLAASLELEGVSGKYFEQGKPVDPAPLARDPALAKRLWDVSAALVGLPA